MSPPDISIHRITSNRSTEPGEYRRPARLRGLIWLSLAVAACLPAATGFAATITWGAPTTISSDTDVNTNGTALYAYTGGTAATVNGVAFTAGNSGTTWGSISLSGFGTDNQTAFGSGTGSPWSTLSTAYKTVLSGGAYGGASAGTVTLNGLTSGHSYSVQIWANDNRGGGEAARTEAASSTGGNTVTLAYEANQASGGGGVGQYVVGTFVANSANLTFTLNPSASGSVQLNAITVRDNGVYVYTPTRVNLAKYQPVITDSTNSSQAAQANGLPASSYITDGLTCNDSYWQSGPSGTHWAQVVFPFPVPVGSAQLAMGRDTVSPPTVFWLQYLTNSTWVTVPGTTVVGNTNKEVNLVFTTPITASSFRFYDSLDGNVYIREMALYPPNGTNGYPFGTDFGVDLARKQPVFGTTNSTGDYPLLAVDGRISPLSAWQTTLVGSNSLLVNLQFTNKIGSAHLYSGATGVAPLTNFVLQYWTGSAWANIPGGSVTGNANGALVIPFTTPVTTTEVQLVFTNTSVSAVQELCIFSADNSYPLGTGVSTNPPITAKYDTFTDSYYSISNAAAGYAVVDSNRVPVLGQSGLTNFLGQYQVLLNYDNGTYRLRNRNTGLCLSGAQLTTNVGALLADEPYSVLPDQEWFLQPVDGTNYYLVNQFSGLVMDTLGGGTAPGTPLVQNVMTNSLTQLWQLPLAAIFPKKGSGGPSLDGIQNSSWCYTWWVTTGTPIPTNNVFYPMNDSAWYLGPTLAENLMDFSRNWRLNGQSQMLMGYNEPDQATQGNLDPTNGAIYWHNFNNMDMPLAAPAPASAGDSWLPIFFGYITNWGLRVDYLPAHLYPGNNSSASSGIWINSLQSEYNTWGIPMWTTEFGCVDWAGNQSWTEENNYNALAEFMWRAESLPWLRKYSIFSFGGALAPDPWTPTTPAPTSNCFDTNNVLTPLGELYGAWDGDANVETNKVYYLHNSSTSKRLANTPGSVSPNAQSILVRDNSVQWTLVSAGASNVYYLVSAMDGRRLSCSGSSVSLVAPGITGTAVQWSLAPYQYGWYYLQHPATSNELSLAYNNSTFTATYTMVTNTMTGTAVQWRFIVPPAAIPWTGGSNSLWGTFGNWNNATVPSVGQSVMLNSLSTAPQFQGQPVTFNSLSTSNLATVVNTTNICVSTITVTTPAGPASIGGTNTLTVGSGIDLSGASQDLTITAPIRIGGCQPVLMNYTVTNTHTLSINGPVTDFGNAALNIPGGGTVTLGGTNTYNGNTTVSGGTLNLTGSYVPSLSGITNIFAVNGGSLTFNMGSGAANFYGDGYGYSPQISDNGSAGTLTLQSGTLNVNTMTNAGPGNYAGLLLGCNSTTANGTLIVNGGNLNVPGRILMAANDAGSKGTLTINGGKVTLGTVGSSGSYTAVNGQGLIWFGGSTSTVNLYGGTLALWSLYDPTAGSSVTVNLSGGTLQALYGNPTFTEVTAGTMTLKVSTNGVTIDPAGYAITIPNALTHDSGLLGADGGLTVSDSIGGGTLTLSTANTYTGPTTISAGTLALSGSGSLASTNLIVAGGATLDVSGETTTFALGSGVTLANSSVVAVLRGNNNCSVGTLSLLNDGVNPSFYQTNGTMTLSASTVVTVNNTGALLATGSRTIVAAAATGSPGNVTGTLPSVVVTGNGAVGAVSLQIDGSGNLNLVIGNSSLQAWSGASSASWTTAGNWVSEIAPGPGSSAWFNSSSTQNLATVLNANFSLTTLTLTTPAGPVSIGGANTLAITNGINLGSAGQNLTITAPVVLGASQSWTVTNTIKLTANGGVSGSAALTVAGGGTVSLGGTNTYTGGTTVSVGATLQMGSANALPGGAGTGNMLIIGTLDLHGNPEAINGLTGSGIVDNTGGGAATLTVGNNNVTTNFSGIIQNTGGTLALVKVGTGAMTLSGTNTYSGGTTINAGVIVPGTGHAISTGALTVNSGATFYPAATLTFTNSVTLNGGSLEIGGGASHILTWTGPAAVTGDSLIHADGGTAGITITGGVTNNGFTLSSQGDGGGANTISGAVSGTSGTVTVTGGTLNLNAANTFAGTNRAGGGTLTINHPNALQYATLDLNAADTGTVNLNNLNALIGALTGSRNLALGSGAVSFGNNNANSTYGGALSGSGSLTKTGSGTLALSAANTFTGNTTINGGTLALSGNGSLASTNLIVAGGTTLDVSGLSATFALGSGCTLTNSSVGAILNGTNNCSTGTLSLVYDGVNPSFIQTNGTMTLSASTVVKVNNTGAILAAGNHTIIAAATAGNAGQVTGMLPSVVVTGNGAAGAASLQINGTGGLDLVVASTIPPQAVINSAVLSGGNLILQGTNGTSSGTYCILISTNMTLPLASWTTNTTGSFTAGGAFSNAIPVTTQAQSFFLIKQP